MLSEDVNIILPKGYYDAKIQIQHMATANKILILPLNIC